LATLDDYERRGGYNVLHPVVQVQEGIASPVLVQSVSVRRLAPGAGDTYNDFRFANEREGKHALSGLALGKIASDAGIRWIEPCTVEARDRDRATGHVYIRVRATGAVLQPNGEHYLISAHKEIDTADEEQQILHQKAAKYRRENKLALTDPIPAAVMATLEDATKRDLMQIREHILGIAETKAQNRVIRKLLSLKQVYTQAELDRPFVIPRLLYRPDLTDPMALERAQIDGRRAATELYGQPRFSSTEGRELPGAEPLPGGSGESAVATGRETGAATGETSTRSEVTAGTESTERSGKGVEPESTDKTVDSSAAGGHSEQQSSPEPELDTPPDMKISELLGAASPWGDLRLNQLAQDHPEFLQGLAQTGRTKRIRDLSAAWVRYYAPVLMEDR
jgi:hypothetical protein